jgi:hypothetical protein
MKEVQDLHIKTDAVLLLFEELLNSAPYPHFLTFKDEILEKSKDIDKFTELNEKLCYILTSTCIDFIYKDVLSKSKYTYIFESIMDNIEEERNNLDTERGMKIETLYAKHWNAMHNYCEVLLDNLANNIKINIK